MRSNFQIQIQIQIHKLMPKLMVPGLPAHHYSSWHSGQKRGTEFRSPLPPTYRSSLTHVVVSIIIACKKPGSNTSPMLVTCVPENFGNCTRNYINKKPHAPIQCCTTFISCSNIIRRYVLGTSGQLVLEVFASV